MPPEEPAVSARLLLPDRSPLPGHLEATAILAFRTPLQEHAPAADTKASALITAVGLMFTLVAKLSGDFVHILNAQGLERWAVLVLTLAFGVLALASVVFAFRTITPRFLDTTPSLAFFRDIASLPRDEYLQRFATMSDDEAIAHILNYNYSLSCICTMKFRELRKAIRLFRYAFACWLVVMLLLNTRITF
jgi:hypothetical protein